MVKIMWKEGTAVPTALANAKSHLVFFKGKHEHPDGNYLEFEIIG